MQSRHARVFARFPHLQNLPPGDMLAAVLDLVSEENRRLADENAALRNRSCCPHQASCSKRVSKPAPVSA